MNEFPDIPGYRLLRLLGRGGMSRVYLAEQVSLGREVALKVLDSEAADDEIFDERFMQEGRLCARLRHPHIVTVHDVGRHDRWHYLAMEYLEAGALVIPEGGMPADEVVAHLKALLSALEYAHARGVVHRDIKPDNILFREAGFPVLTDFGIAKALDRLAALTRIGMVLGTAQYMSPEQARGLAVDARADLYSLGVVAYEMFTGAPPFAGDDPLLVGIQHITGAVPELDGSLADFQPFIDALLAKDPASRPATAAEAARLLAAAVGRGLQRAAARQQAAIEAEERRLVAERELIRQRAAEAERLRREQEALDAERARAEAEAREARRVAEEARAAAAREAARLEALRREAAEREEAIRREAAEALRAEREQAARAERARVEAEARASAEAEAARRQAEEARAAAELEAQRAAAEFRAERARIDAQRRIEADAAAAREAAARAVLERESLARRAAEQAALQARDSAEREAEARRDADARAAALEASLADRATRRSQRPAAEAASIVQSQPGRTGVIDTVALSARLRNTEAETPVGTETRIASAGTGKGKRRDAGSALAAASDSDAQASPVPPTAADPSPRLASASLRKRLLGAVAVVVVLVAGYFGWMVLQARSAVANAIAEVDAKLGASSATPADGSVAVALLDFVRARDPHAEDVAAAVSRSAATMVQRAGTAFEQGDRRAAAAWLDLAARIDPANARVAETRKAIEAADLSERALVPFNAALEAQRLVGEGGAVGYFDQLVNAGAGQDAIADARDRLAVALVSAYRSSPEPALLSVMDRIAPRHPLVVAIRSELDADKVRAAAEQKRQEVVEAARLLERAGRWKGADGALAKWRDVLAVDPVHPEALAASDRAVAAWLGQASRWLADREPERARPFLADARGLAPGDRRIDELEAKAAGIEESLRREMSGPEPGTPEAARLDDLLARARVAAADGRLLSPPADCAYDLWKSALRIAPRNPEANDGLRRLPETLEKRFRALIAEGKVEQADELMDAMEGANVAPLRIAVMQEDLLDAMIGAVEAIRGTDPQRAARLVRLLRTEAPNDPRVQRLAD